MSAALGSPGENNDSFTSDTDAFLKSDGARNSEYDGILSWLSVVDHTSQLCDIVKRKTKGTGDWLLDSDLFDTWVNTSGRIMLRPGVPGVGKTVIASTVIKRLQSLFQLESQVGVVYFFCGFNGPRKSEPSEVLSSLLKQLVEQQHSLPKSIKGLHKRHYDRSTRPSYAELKKVFHTVASSFARIFIVMDALDESEIPNQGWTMAVREFSSLCEEARLSLFVTSTFALRITGDLKDSLVLEIRANQDDMRKYLDEKITKLPSNVSCDIDMREDIKKYIVLAANGVFLLARLYFHYLTETPTPEAIRLALDSFKRDSQLATYNGNEPQQLDAAHHLVMQTIERKRPRDRELAKAVFIWVTCSRRPLGISELQHALDMELEQLRFDPNNMPNINDIQSACSGLIDIIEGSDAIFIHKLTKDYLISNRDLWYSEDCHSHISKICAKYLCHDAFDGGVCFSDEDFESRLRTNALYDYAARNWGEHARMSSKEVSDSVTSFLSDPKKIAASSQALLVSKRSKIDPGYSQKVPQDFTAIHIAAYFGLKEIMISLIADENGLDLKDTHGRTPLSYAAENGRESTVQLLLESDHIDPNSVDVNNRTPLSWAAECGHQQVVQSLLNAGARVDFQDRMGYTPLSCAAANGHESVVQLMIGIHGVNPDIKDIYGQTALSHAAAMGYESVVQLILSHPDIDPDLKDINGYTPLSHAAANGHLYVVQLLLAADSVNPDSKDINGITPLSYAAANGYKNVVQCLVNTVGVNPDSKDINGITPLSRAAANGHLSVVRTLLDVDYVDLESKDIHGQTPYMRAASKGHTTVTQSLQKAAERRNV